MHHIIVQSSNHAFIELARKLLQAPDYISSPRGLETKELIAVSIQINNPYHRIVTNVHRSISMKYLVGEWLWYERGSNSLEEISFYSKFWQKVSDDKKTVNSAYGKKIYQQCEFTRTSQWERVRTMLEQEIDSRRSILVFCSPQDVKIKTNDIPCTMYLQFFIRHSQLHLIANMRSNDLILGFTYDVAIFTLWQEKMLVELQKTYPQLSMGTYTHQAGSLHVYAKYYDVLKKVLADPNNNLEISIPRIQDIEELKVLQDNERSLRLGNGECLKLTKDPFCSWCQKQLIATK